MKIEPSHGAERHGTDVPMNTKPTASFLSGGDCPIAYDDTHPIECGTEPNAVTGFNYFQSSLHLLGPNAPIAHLPQLHLRRRNSEPRGDEAVTQDVGPNDALLNGFTNDGPLRMREFVIETDKVCPLGSHAPCSLNSLREAKVGSMRFDSNTVYNEKGV